MGLLTSWPTAVFIDFFHKFCFGRLGVPSSFFSSSLCLFFQVETYGMYDTLLLYSMHNDNPPLYQQQLMEMLLRTEPHLTCNHITILATIKNRIQVIKRSPRRCRASLPSLRSPLQVQPASFAGTQNIVWPEQDLAD